MDLGPKGPLKGTLEDLCVEDTTRSTAWKFYLSLKKVRPGLDNQVLPKGYMSICAFLASQHTTNLDVSFKDAFKKTGLNSDARFWQNLEEIEKILLEASASSISPRLHYSLLPTYESRCEHCKKCNTKCFVIPHVFGKRQSQKCIWCFSTKRPCAPNHDVQDNPEDDSQWSPPAKKRSLDERCKKIEQRGEKPVQKQVAKRTVCPELPPFNVDPPKATSSTATTGPSTPRQPAPSSSTATATSIAQASISKASRPMNSKPSATSVAAAKPTSSSPAGPSRQHTNSEMSPSSQPPPQARATTPMQPAGKATSGTSLQVFRKPGPGRSSTGLVPLAASSDSSAPPATDASPVAGPSSSVSQPRKPPSANASKTPSKTSTQNTSPSSSNASVATQQPPHPTSPVKKERPATGSGSAQGSASTPARRPSSSQAQAPVPQSQREPPVFDFGPAGGVTAFDNLQIPTTLEPAIESIPAQRPSPRGRSGASPQMGLSKPSTTPAKRPSDGGSPQTAKKRRINVVGATMAGLQEPPSPSVPPVTPRPSQAGAQPTPPHSRKHSPAGGTSASPPSSPMLAPMAPLVASPLGLSQLSREIEELPSLGSPRTRLPTPVSPLSRAVTLPAFDDGSSARYPGPFARDASRLSRESSPRPPMNSRPSLPTPRSSLSAPVVTPPVSSAEQRRPTVQVDVVMQDISAPPPTPPRSSTPQSSVVALEAALAPLTTSAPVSVPPCHSSFPVPLSVPSVVETIAPVAPPAVSAPAPALAPLPPTQATPASTPASASAPALPVAPALTPAPAPAPAPVAAPTSTPSPIPAQYIQLVYRKAQELAAHLAAHGCAQLELRCALRDLAVRLARIDALRQHGEVERARGFDGPLVRAALEVVACRTALRRRGEPIADDVLDVLVEELEERVQMLPVGGAVP